MTLIPIILTAVGAGASIYAIGKGMDLSRAYDNITFTIDITNPKFDGKLLPYPQGKVTVDAVTVLTNPTNTKVTILQPFIQLFKGDPLKGKVIAVTNVSDRRTYTLEPYNKQTIVSKITIPKLSYLSDMVISVITEAYAQYSTNQTPVVESLTKSLDKLFQGIFLKTTIGINNIPVVMQDPVSELLAGTEESAILRKIEDGSQYDKYFALPKGTDEILLPDGNVHQTVALMNRIVDKDYKLLEKASHEIFDKGTVEKTTKYIFDWIFKYLKYNLEEGEQLRNPLVTYHLGQRKAIEHFKKTGQFIQAYSVDCDDISIFIACILKNLNISYAFKIAGYGMYGTGGYGHVYAIANPNFANPIIIDPVYHKYNAEKTPTIMKTYPSSYKALAGIPVHYLSGLDDSVSISDSLYQFLIESRNAIANNPQLVTVAHPDTLIGLYDYLIEHWNKTTRDEALQIVAQKEEELIAQGSILTYSLQGYDGLGFFGELGKIRICKLIRKKAKREECFKNKAADKLAKEEAKKNGTKDNGKKWWQNIMPNAKDALTNLVDKNYANETVTTDTNTTTNTTEDKPDVKDHSTMTMVKTFVSDNKIPLAIGGVALIGGVLVFINKDKIFKNEQ